MKHATLYDAIIVGARCAGAPTAMLLARKGYRVLLVGDLQASPDEDDRATLSMPVDDAPDLHELAVRMAETSLLLGEPLSRYLSSDI